MRELTLVNIQQVNKSESAKGRGSEEPTRNSRYEYEYVYQACKRPLLYITIGGQPNLRWP